MNVASGWYLPKGEQVARNRESVMDPAETALEQLLKSIRRTLQVDGRPPKTRPRGIFPYHPRLDLLRNRGMDRVSKL